MARSVAMHTKPASSHQRHGGQHPVRACGVFAATASLALHAILFLALLAKPSAPESQADEAPVFVALPLVAGVSIANSVPEYRTSPVPIVQAPAIAPQAIDLPAMAPIVEDTAVADSFAEAREPESNADLNALHHLESIYVGQVRARLARILQMTLSDQEALQGPCEARLIQNERGDVMDIELNDCGDDETRRDALTAAIRRASPLPAPPAGLALGSSLTLDLSGL